MYNVKESVIRKAFEDAVKAGEVVFTGGFSKAQYGWGVDNRRHYTGDLCKEVLVEAKPDPYEVTGHAEERVEYTYKGFKSAVYHADGDFLGYYIYANGVDMGYDYYGLFQIAYIVGDVALSDPQKAMELYVAEMLRLEKEEQLARENAKKAFEEKVAELAKKHRILYDGSYPQFYVDGGVVLDIKNNKAYPIVSTNMGCVCFYAPYSEEGSTYYLHIFTHDNKKTSSQKEARLSFRDVLHNWELEEFFAKRRLPKAVIERWRTQNS